MSNRFESFTTGFMRLSPARKMAIAGLLLAVSILIAYSNSFNTGFHFDDSHQIVKNQHIRHLGNIPEFFTDASTASYEPGRRLYRPVTLAGFAVSYAFSGYSPAGYHIFNISLHLINSFLVLLLVQAILKDAGYKEAFIVSLAASLVFALHPVQTAAVTYISGSAALLATFFYLSAFLCFVRFRGAGQTPGVRKYLFAALAPLFYLLGLLSKEIAATLPAAMLAYDLLFVIPKSGGIRRARMAWAIYLPFAAVLLAFVSVKNALQGFLVDNQLSYTSGEYLLSEMKVLIMYMRLLLLPVNQNSDYFLQPARHIDIKVAASVLVAALIVYLLYRTRKKFPALTFFGAWFFIALLPESSVFPIDDIAFEHRLYLPSVGFIAAMVLMLYTLTKARAAKAGAAIAVLAAFGILTFGRNSVWATDATLWSDAASKSGSVRAYANLGHALLIEGRYSTALAALNTALKIDPDYTQVYAVHNNIGLCLLELGMNDEAVEEFNRSAQAYPEAVEPVGNIGLAYLRMGRYGDAAGMFKKAVAMNPGYGLFHLRLAQAYDNMQNYDGALEEARTALSLAGDEEQRREAGELVSRLDTMGR